MKSVKHIESKYNWVPQSQLLAVCVCVCVRTHAHTGGEVGLYLTGCQLRISFTQFPLYIGWWLDPALYKIFLCTLEFENHWVKPKEGTRRKSIYKSLKSLVVKRKWVENTKIFQYSCLPAFWPCWVFVAACGLSLVEVSGGYSSLRHVGFSLRWLLLVQSTGCRHVGFSSCSTWALGRTGLSSCVTRPQ